MERRRESFEEVGRWEVLFKRPGGWENGPWICTMARACACGFPKSGRMDGIAGFVIRGS